MGIPGSANPMLFGGAGAYQINQSLRFNSADSANCSRTFSSSNRKTWTWSAWVKRSAFGTAQALFSAGSISGTYNYHHIQFDTSDRLNLVYYPDATSTTVTTTARYRDPSAWYHIVAVWDTTQSTASNRAVLYVNGQQITALDTATYSAQNTDGFINSTVHASGVHYIGRLVPTETQYFNGYLAEVNFIDGTALTPSSFGETDTITGAWIPKKYSGSYGTNGFYLKYESSGIGTDSSGNGNNWTANNFSTSGTGTDVMSDTPTNNYATMNPIDAVSTSSASDGNLVTSNTNNVSSPGIRSTFSMPSGKWYWEVTCGTFTSAATWMLGIQESNATVSNWQAATTYAYYSSNGQKYNNGSGTAYGNTYTTNDVIGIAYDADNGKLYFAKNNTWQNSGDPVAGTGAAWSGLTGSYSAWVGTGLYTVQSIFNFGQRSFSYTPPTGYKALNTANLPEPTIKKPSSYMDVVTYTGTGATRTISGLGFSPDFVWFKNRATTADHYLYDAVRGATKGLYSNLTSQEITETNQMTAFTSDGFTVSTGGATNGNGNGLVAWCWDANGAGSSNTAGSITSTVSANATAGFSIVSYTGTGSALTVGHGLGVAPSFMIAKPRSLADEWVVWHKAFAMNEYIYLNRNYAKATTTNPNTFWNNTAPASTVISIGANSNTNANGSTNILYAFSEVAGYSKFGSYSGNGSSDGPFVFCGFRPRWVMIKRTDSTANWQIYDTARDTTNKMFRELVPNSSAEENSVSLNIAVAIDALSNGFKLRDSDTAGNASGGTYIFAAFSETAFKYANAR